MYTAVFAAGLDLRDQVARHAGFGRQLGLGPATIVAPRPERVRSVQLGFDDFDRDRRLNPAAALGFEPRRERRIFGARRVDCGDIVIIGHAGHLLLLRRFLDQGLYSFKKN
jgi:hypothetical protein